jgi:hypothetical protein
MNETNKAYQTTKLNEAAREIHATVTAIPDAADTYSVSRGQTCCKAIVSDTMIVVDSAQGQVQVTRNSVPDIHHALNAALIRPLLDQAAATLSLVVRNGHRSDFWQIVDSKDTEVTVNVRGNVFGYATPSLTFDSSPRAIENLDVANLRKHMAKYMVKSRADVKYQRSRKASQIEENGIKTLIKKGLNDGGIAPTEQRDLRFSEDYMAVTGTTGGAWTITIAYKREFLTANLKIETSLQHAYAAGLILAKRIAQLDQV